MTEGAMPSTDLMRRSTILIVDDEPANVVLLERLLKREGFSRLLTTTDPRRALPLFQEHPVDLVLLDLMMPELDGYALLEAFSRLIPAQAYLPILVLTADVTLAARRRALSLGARDFLTKPFDAVEAVLRIFNLLETRLLTLELARHGLARPETERPLFE
jgi:CheY-like chemotaxis protein